MQFDFSQFYKTETVLIGHDGDTSFSVTVQEIPHGKMADLQAALISGVDVDITAGKQAITKSLSKAFANGGFNPSKFTDNKAIAAIQEWTLKDAKGDDVPVCIEAWRALPHWVTEEIEKAIERLNPDLDENFQSD